MNTEPKAMCAAMIDSMSTYMNSHNWDAIQPLTEELLRQESDDPQITELTGKLTYILSD